MDRDNTTSKKFTSKLGFGGQIYLLSVEFAEAGRIAKVDLDIPGCDKKGPRIAAQTLARDINNSLAFGIPLESLAASFGAGRRVHPVSGFKEVMNAADHFDMVFQVLAKARPPRESFLRLVGG